MLYCACASVFNVNEFAFKCRGLKTIANCIAPAMGRRNGISARRVDFRSKGYESEALFEGAIYPSGSAFLVMVRR